MWNRSMGLLALSAALLLVAAACSAPATDAEAGQPTGESGSEAAGTQDSSSSEQGSPADGDVNVSLTEFAVELSQTEFQAGVEYVFTVVNDGAIEHEMMLMPPVPADTEMDMEEIDELAIAVFHVDHLPPGGAETKTVVFPEAGEIMLEAACRVPGHYEAGMVTTITVTS